MIGRALARLANSALLGRQARAGLRALRRRLAIWRRCLPPRRDGAPAWVSPATRISAGGAPFSHPAIAIVVDAASDPAAVQRFLERQTERSFTLAPDAVGVAPCVWLPDGNLDALPATTLEAALLTLASEALHLVTFSPPCAEAAAVTVFRQPLADAGKRRAGAIGRELPPIGSPASGGALGPPPVPFARSGPYLLDPDTAAAKVVELAVTDASARLAGLPSLAGETARPAVVFLLPFLAIGGAERLLLDLLADLRADYRCLVVTLEPHRSELGETVSLARRLTDHVYMLGDWLPRAAIPSALLALLRRHAVASLVSWNGTVAFYDALPDLHRQLPGLRIVHQLFDRSDGFLARTTPELAAAIDAHIVANRATAAALRRRGIAPASVALIHHGVNVPPLATHADRRARREAACARLGLPVTKVIVGTFARAHAQKRPFDMLTLARRLAPEGYQFLWLGGGPLAAALRAELARRDSGNVTLLPMTHTPEPWFDALDICLLPSAYEGLPVFLLEGLARAIPCVATAVGDVPLLVAGGGGYTAAVGDLGALERGLRALGDPATRRREGERGRDSVLASFNRDRFCAETRRVIFGGASP